MKALAVCALLAATPAVFAGVFSPNEPCPFEVRPDGTAQPLPLSVFKLFLNERVAALQPGSPDAEPGSGAPTFKGLARRRLQGAPPAPSRAEMVGLSADLLRLGRAGDVIELLKPVLRDRSLDYRLLAHLALAHAAVGDGDMAVKRQTDALLDGDAPAELAGTKPEQLKWMLKVDRGFTRLWLLAAQREANPQSKPTDPDVLPIFKRDGLPPDAVAIAQQMVLWSPRDNNLLWLLGAVHLASDQPEAAFDILDQCRERKLTWPKFREAHAKAETLYRALPKAGADEPLTPPAPPEPPKGLFAVVDPVRFGLALGAFALLALGLLALQVRRWRRRR